MNRLYFGDNLDILRDHIGTESVDLIYLDPPFNSNATYNVLFQEKSGKKSAAQITAFDDTWHWGYESEYAYQNVVTEGPRKLADLLQAMRAFLGQNDMMAYLVMMAQRMVELHRVLKPTGTIYLHCDPTASHYLRLLMDATFGVRSFRNEVVWKRTSAHSSANRYGPVHDAIMYYSKTDQYVWNAQYQAYDPAYVELFFDQVDAAGRRWKRTDLTGAGAWFSRDVVQALFVSDDNYDDDSTVQIVAEQNASIPGTEVLSLRWTDWDNDVVQVVYSLVTVPESSLRELRRTVLVNSAVTESHAAAQYIDVSTEEGTELDRTRFEWSSDDKEVVRFVATAVHGGESLMRVYEARPRSTV